MKIDKKQKRFFNAYSVTYGDRAENSVGMEILGESIKKGLDGDEMKETTQKFKAAGFETHLIALHELLPEKNRTEENEAFVLIVKNGSKALI